MSKDQRHFTVLYALIVITDIIGLVWYPAIRVATKPLIVTSLLGYYILKEAGEQGHRQHHLFLTALIFALLGDIFLNIEMEGMFVIGLFSFLITQLLYSTVFYEDRIGRFNWKILIFLGVFAVILNYLLWDFTAILRWQILLYSLSLCVMVFTAFSRNPILQGYRHVVIGALLFLISDSLLAFNHFYASAIWLSVLVMATYTAAQYFIVVGYKMKKADDPKRGQLPR